MEIKHRDTGRLKSYSELRDEAHEKLVFAMCDLSEDSKLSLGNEYRSWNGDPQLYENTTRELSDQLYGLSVVELLELGRDEWDESDSYFSYGCWNGFTCTNDVWDCAEPEDIADALLEDEFRTDMSEITDILDEFREAVEALNNYNPYRAEGQELLNKYVSCEASVTDLLQYIDRLVRNDEVWKE